jgi:PEP-CTERM motif
VKILRLSAALAVLILAASTASAAVMDFGNALGASGGYTTQAYYQAMLGGQPMTAGQQAYADQEDQLRQLGFLSELGGNLALGQMFYSMAYAVIAPSSALNLVGGASGLGSSSTAPSGLGAGSSQVGDGLGAGSSQVGDGRAAGSSGGSDGSVIDDESDDGSVFVTTILPDPGGFSVFAVPEPSTWAMMLIGFGGLGYAGWRGSRKPALHSA